jgi:hypothetical protein
MTGLGVWISCWRHYSGIASQEAIHAMGIDLVCTEYVTISMCLGCGRLGMIRPLPNPPRSLGVDRVRNMSEVVDCIRCTCIRSVLSV